MAQLTLYLDDATQVRLREAAARRQVSQSQFVAELIRQATVDSWPDQVLDLAGAVPDFAAAEALRAAQADDVERAPW